MFLVPTATMAQRLVRAKGKIRHARIPYDHYHLLHAARADLLRRLGSSTEAAKSHTQALALVTNGAERRFLERRRREVQRRDDG